MLTDSGDRQARHTAGQLERMQAVFAKLLPNATDDPGSRIVVLALRDRKDFQSVEPAAYLAKNALDLAGLFMRGEDKNYILLRLDGSGDHPYTTVYHEYTHYMTRHADYLPVWLNEGLAQFYQNTEINDHDVRLGQADANQILFLREQRLLPLTTLFAVDVTSPFYHEENKGNIFYAESWALTHFLFLQDFGKPEGRLRVYVRHLMSGESSIVAAQNAFGDLGKLQAALSAYINSGEYRPLTMALQNAVDEKTLPVEAIPTADADAVRADVLARNGRNQEAEALDKAVLAEAPESAQAHESMGMIELREGNQGAAEKWFSEAVALHSTDFLSYYYAGALNLRDVRSGSASAAEDLRECLRMNPHFAPALVSLSQFDAVHAEKLDEAMELSLRAVQMDPRNLEYRLNASEVRVARKELPSAIAGLQVTLKLARTPEERARVENRLEEVKSYQDQLTKGNTARAEGVREMAMEASRPRPTGPAAVADSRGKVLHPIVLAEPDHKFPDGPLKGPKHTVTGRVREVSCFAPKGLLLTVEGAGKAVPLYSNDMYAISYTAGNFTPKEDINPCREFQGLRATVVYGAVDDPVVAGQIVSMELNH